jgi:drug/metabolite transporter (DMT)-like permease
MQQSQPMSHPGRMRIVLAFAAVYLIWGSTFLGIFYAIQTIPPFLMAGSRFICAGTIMYVIGRLRGDANPEPNTWRDAFIVGGCLLLFGNGAVTIAEKWVPTGLAALLVATEPIDVALLSWVTGIAPRPSRWVWFGLIVGFCGVGFLVSPAFAAGATGGSSHLGLGVVILLIGSFVWAAGSLYALKAKHPSSFIMSAAQQMLCGGLLLLLAGFALGQHHDFDVHGVTWLSLGGWIYLVLIGALVGYTAYFFLLRRCAPAKVATYAYVNPVVAIILGALFAGERLSLPIILGAGLIIVSVMVVITAQQLQTTAATSVPAGFAEAKDLR